MYYIRIMADEMTDFLARVPGSGYSWGTFETAHQMNPDGVEGKSRVVTDAVPIGTHYTFRRYAPLLEFSGLFRTFGLDTEPTEDGVSTFANKYGVLGLPLGILFPLGGGKSHLGTGEILESWTREIVDMRLGVKLWDAARGKSLAELSRVIHWSDDKTVNYNDPESGRFAVIAGKETRPDILERLKTRDLIAPAYWYL